MGRSRVTRMVWALRCLLVMMALVGPVGIAAAQLSQGDAVRVAARIGAKVNVRGEPTVRDGNVVGVAGGGDGAVVLETDARPPFGWYRLRAIDGTFEGWIRGDLVKPAPDIVIQPRRIDPPSETRTDAAETASGDAPAKSATERPPLDARSDWTRHLPTIFAAVRDCTRVSSAQPAVAVSALPLSRGMVNVTVRDSSIRYWDCIIRTAGGTPVRFDPLAGAGLSIGDRGAPAFMPAGARPPAATACSEIEPITDPATSQLGGWLIHDICTNDGKSP